MATTVDNNVMQVNCSIKPLGRLVELDKTLVSRNISVKQENFFGSNQYFKKSAMVFIISCKKTIESLVLSRLSYCNLLIAKLEKK